MAGVSRVLTVEHAALAHPLPEPIATLLASLQRRAGFSHVLAPSSTFGRNVLPRAAALLDVQPISDVVRILNGATFVRPIYAGNALATVSVAGQAVSMLTVRPTAFPVDEAASSSGAAAAPIESAAADDLAACTSGAAQHEQQDILYKIQL